LRRNLEVTSKAEEKLKEENRRLREEVKLLRSEYELEREARLSTEKEKKGLSLLDMLTRSGLTKSVDVSSNPEVAARLRQYLEDAIQQSLGRSPGESDEPPRLSAVT
jgi:hypothetical protein